MVRCRCRQSIEVGNRKTGYYRRYESEQEFEGPDHEVIRLIKHTAREIGLPGNYISSKSLLDNFPKLLQLGD